MPVTTERGRRILVPADLDEGALDGFFAELDITLEESPWEISLDCSLLDHATSGHINILWDAQTRCEHAGIPMRLLSVRYGLERVLKILDLFDLFTVEQVTAAPGDDARDGNTGVFTPPALELEIRPRMEEVSEAVVKIHDYLVRLGLPGSYAFDMETVFYEVATNIRRHGGLGENELVSIRAIPGEERVTMRFADPGQPFDPTGRKTMFDPRQAIRLKQTNGIGLTMIKRLVDTISYERVGNRLNVLTLEKKLSPGWRWRDDNSE
jgi:anti-sigma regulatory factor (Ser/Thr protein kinase)/anti-anti-sigma regulatory factor